MNSKNTIKTQQVVQNYSPIELQALFTTLPPHTLEPGRNTFTHFFNGKEIGNSELYFHKKKKCLSWNLFYPLKKAPELTRGKGNNFTTQKNNNLHLGTLAHYNLLESIYSQAKNYLITHTDKPSFPREKQLEAMNIEVFKYYLFEEYFERSKDFAQKKGFF